MKDYGATEIPVPETTGTLVLGPIPKDDETLEQVLGTGLNAMVTLVTDRELRELGAPHLREILARHRLPWIHFPIPDFDVPSIENSSTWKRIEADIAQRLKAGERVLVHCRAGLGRTGMIAARLLTACGLAPEEAIAQVRTRRPGTIETPAQLDWAKRADVGRTA